jgi:hypothetical protein
MSTVRFVVVAAACAAIGFLTYRIGTCQDGVAKGKPAVEERWAADDQPPADREGHRGPPGQRDRNGPPPGPGIGGGGMEPGGDEPGEAPPGGAGPGARDRNGPPRGGQGPMGPMGPMQGPPGMPPGMMPGMGPGPGGMLPGGPIGGPGGMGTPWSMMEKTDPEMYKLMMADMKLERETRELAVQYRQAPSDRRAEIKEKIKELVAKHFNVRQERWALDIKRLEAKLQQLRERMERRLKARDKLVAERVSELLGREDEEHF